MKLFSEVPLKELVHVIYNNGHQATLVTGVLSMSLQLRFNIKISGPMNVICTLLLIPFPVEYDHTIPY